MRSLFAMTLLALASHLAVAQQPASPLRSVASGTGLIAGRVVEAGSQTPVPEAIVTLWGPKGDEPRRVMVDGQGRFVFTGLAAGPYRLTSAQFEYLSGAFGARRRDDDLAAINLTDGQRFTEATIPMFRLASIKGRVVDEAGEPVVGVKVLALERVVRNGQPQLIPVFDGGTIRLFTTDDRGAYRASLLPPGDYTVAVPSTVSTFPVEVVQTAQENRLDLGVSEVARLGDSRYLQVGNQVVATMSGRPIPRARDGSPISVYETTFFPGTPIVDQASVVSLTAGETRPGIDVRIVATPTVQVSGQLLGADGPLPLTQFRVVRAGGTQATEFYGLEAATGITDARGNFLLFGMPRGSYILRVDVSRPATPPRTRPVRLAAVREFTVANTDVADVVVNVQPWATVTGHVEVRGQPIAASAMMLRVSGTNRGFEGRVGQDLSFAIELPPGRYLLLVETPQGVCVSTSAGKDISDDLLEVAEKNIADVRVVCSETRTRVSGVVRDDRGQLETSARVVVFPTDRSYWTAPNYRLRRNISKWVTPEGTYEISDLPPGEYYVAAVSDNGGEWELAAFRDKVIPSAVKITVGAGQSRSLDLQVVK